MQIHKQQIVNIVIILTLGLFGFASYFQIQSFWGVNHLQFLPQIFNYIFWGLSALIIYILYGYAPVELLHIFYTKVDKFFWGKKKLYRHLFCLFCTALFYFFYVKTYYLGDGYVIITRFGYENYQATNWIELGSTSIIKSIQYLLGGYSIESAIQAFQIVSILSGYIVLWNIISIVGKLFENYVVRIFAFVTLCFSGSVLLFFGYVEYYPLLWLGSLLFLNLALSLDTDKKNFYFLIAAFLFSVFMHMQAFYFSLGLILVCLYKYNPSKIDFIFNKKFNIVVTCFVLIGMMIIGLLKLKGVEFTNLFLSLFKIQTENYDYAVFSYNHLFDILNLILLIFPGFFILLTLFILRKKKNDDSIISKLLMLFSLGSFSFLLLVDPVLGLARDWDLMSLTLFAPCLFLLYILKDSVSLLNVRTVTAYFVLTVCMTISYVSVYANIHSSEQRTFSMLNYYGNKDKGGWVTLTKRITDRKLLTLAESAMNRYFPEHKTLSQIYDLIENQEYERAFELAQKNSMRYPDNINFTQALAVLYGKKNQFDMAEQLYKKVLSKKKQHLIYNELGQLYLKQGKYLEALETLKEAHRLSPKTLFITEALGLTYIYLTQYDMASMTADSMFIQDINSPGGHLIKMSVALLLGDKATAKQHYVEYLKYGTMRSDYNSNLEHYKYLIDEK